MVELRKLDDRDGVVDDSNEGDSQNFSLKRGGGTRSNDSGNVAKAGNGGRGDTPHDKESGMVAGSGYSGGGKAMRKHLSTMPGDTRGTVQPAGQGKKQLRCA